MLRVFSYLLYHVICIVSCRIYLIYLFYLIDPIYPAVYAIYSLHPLNLSSLSFESSLFYWQYPHYPLYPIFLVFLIYPILFVTYTHADMHMQGRNTEILRYFGMDSAESWECWLMRELMGQIQVCWIYTPRHMGHISYCWNDDAYLKPVFVMALVTEGSALTMGHEADSLPRSTLDWFTSVSTRTLGEHEHWAMPWPMVGFDHGIYQEKWWEIYKKHPKRVILMGFYHEEWWFNRIFIGFIWIYIMGYVSNNWMKLDWRTSQSLRDENTDQFSPYVMGKSMVSGETEGIPRLNSTSHGWVRHPTTNSRFPGARQKKKGDNLLFGPSTAWILQKGFRQPLTGPGSPFQAGNLLFGPSAAWILQKGFRQPLTGPGSPFQAGNLLFGPSAARILQKGARQPLTGPGSPCQAGNLLFGPSTARILQKGARQPLTGLGSLFQAGNLLFGPSTARILQKGARQPLTGLGSSSGRQWDRQRPGFMKKASGSFLLDRFTPLCISFKLLRLGSGTYSLREVAAPVGTAASTILGIRYSGLLHLSASNEICLLCFFYSLSCFCIRLGFHGGEDLWVSTWKGTTEDSEAIWLSWQHGRPLTSTSEARFWPGVSLGEIIFLRPWSFKKVSGISGRQSPFWPLNGLNPSQRLPAASKWTGFSFSGPQSPFWTVSGPDRILQKGARQPLTGPGSPCQAGNLLFGPSTARILQKGFRQPLTGPLHASGHLFQAVTAWIAAPWKRLLAASHWTGFFFSGRQSPFWTVSGPDPSTRRRLARERKKRFSSSSEYGSRKK